VLFGFNLWSGYRLNESLYRRTVKPLRIGVMDTMVGLFDPVPASRRAVREAALALESVGHEMVEFRLPIDPLVVMTTYLSLLTADGSLDIKDGLRGEPKTPGIRPLFPHPMDDFFHRFLRDPRMKCMVPEMKLRDLNDALEIQMRSFGIQKAMKEHWESEKIDLLIFPGFPIPAFHYDAYPELFFMLCYTGIWNFFNYPVGVVPVTKVDPAKDQLKDRILNNYSGAVTNRPDFLEAVIEKHYDLRKMEGLPVGVQIVGSQFGDEIVLRGMKELENSLGYVRCYIRFPGKKCSRNSEK